MTGADLLAALKQPWRHGEHVEARGLVLEDTLTLDGLEVCGFDLTGARLKGGLSAKGTVFRGLSWLRGVEVCGLCDLSGAMFRTDFRADGLIAKDVVLDDAHVQGVVSLANAKIASLSMKRALMMANVTLEGAQISDSVMLDNAEIMGGFWTAGARINALQTSKAEISGRLRLPT